MNLFTLWIDDVYQGSCSTECFSNGSDTCNCVCHARFHNTRTDLAIYTLLASPEALVESLALSNPGTAVRIEIDYPHLLNYLTANCQIRSLTRIRGIEPG